MVWNVIVESTHLDRLCQQFDAGQMAQVRESLKIVEMTPGLRFLGQVVNAEFEDYFHQLALPCAGTSMEQYALSRAYLSGLMQGLAVLTKGGYTELLTELQARVDRKLKDEAPG